MTSNIAMTLGIEYSRTTQDKELRSLLPQGRLARSFTANKPRRSFGTIQVSYELHIKVFSLAVSVVYAHPSTS